MDLRWVTSMFAVFRNGTEPAVGILPARVQRLLALQETLSERLIGWVQLLVVGLLATLYLVAPRPADAPAGSLFDPVPLALVGYTLFTIARLALAYRRSLPGWMLLVSILADVSLLMVMIWSFHSQYGQTAPFSLKVPTFVYLFVFIAIRALRFDHRYVLAAGLAAAAGWVILICAVLARSGNASITRSFVEHLSSNRVLLGAEFDKILTVLLVTGVLALAVKRGRRLFVTAVRGQAAVEDLSRFFGKGVSDTVVGAEERAVAGTLTERDAAIMMLDIRGFTTLTAGLAPRRIVALLTSLHARVIPAVRRHHGVIDKFLGDGIMATFGAVQPSERAAAEALAALEAVLAEAAQWQTEHAADLAGRLELHGAVVAGTVVFAVVGAGDRLEYTVIGEAVNLAAKLEKQNKIEGTRALTTQATFDRAVAQGFVPSRPAVPRVNRLVAGAAAPVDLVVLA